MIKIAIISALAAALATPIEARAIEVFDSSPARFAHQSASAAAPVQAGLPGPILSELPEPEVFAMMLLGLVLIGYRARRDSSEKFQ